MAMININFTNIDNSKLVARLIPWWVRGKKLSLLIQAILHPLISVHAAFKAWALEKFIVCHITAQKDSLEWYLRYKLKSHFINEGDGFYIVHGINEAISCFSLGVWYNDVHWSNELKWDIDSDNPTVDLGPQLSCFNTGKWENGMHWNNFLCWDDEPNTLSETGQYLESMNSTTVYAPAIIDTVIYNHEDYERDIRNIMSKFMINFNPINIIIANT